MAKKKAAKKKTSKRSLTPKVDSAGLDSADAERSSKATPRGEPAGDFMEVGKDVVSGMRLRCICRGHQGTIAWSACGRFIASPSEDKTIRIWDVNDRLRVAGNILRNKGYTT